VKYVVPDQALTNQHFLNLFPTDDDNQAPAIPEQEAKKAKLAEQRQIVKDYLNQTRGLDDEVLRKYQVGFTVQQFLIENAEGESEWKDQICVTFPWIEYADQIVGENGKVHDSFTFSSLDKLKSVKAKKSSGSIPDPITINDHKCYILRTKYRAIQTKGLQRILPKGGSWGFFGWHTTRESEVKDVPKDEPVEFDAEGLPLEAKPKKSIKSTKSKKSIILTEGEYDAMAVSQGLRLACKANDALLKIPVVSLPNGCNSLPNELVELLHDYQHIYLWMDNDKSGQDAVEKFTRKLGVSRCLIVKPPADMMVST
jgi:twinkle protein